MCVEVIVCYISVISLRHGYITEMWLRFLYNAPTPKFHHRMFTCLEVIMLTDKQTNERTDVAENIQHSSLCYDVG